jgi:hypothetical protein
LNLSLSKLPIQILYLQIIILGLLGFVGAGLFNPTLFFEGILLVFFIFNFSTIAKDILWVPVFSIVYLVLSLIYAIILQGNHILDFFLIFKSFIYLIVLSQFVGKKSLDPEFSRKAFLVVLGLFLVKYLYLSALGTSRQSIRVFDESNFELMFLSYLFLLDYNNHRKTNYLELVLLLLTFFISGSRSGLVILVFLIGCILLRDFSWKNLLLLMIFTPLGLGLIYFIFLNRSAGDSLENIDRYIFFLSFLKEVKTWTFLDFLIGSERITALSPETCGKFTYYTKLFSFRNDGTCYSVMLHSFLMRVIFDHGILGLVFLSSAIYQFVRKSGFDRFISFLVLMVLILNSLSVSAFNSVYAILGISLFLISKQPAIESNE